MPCSYDDAFGGGISGSGVPRVSARSPLLLKRLDCQAGFLLGSFGQSWAVLSCPVHLPRQERTRIRSATLRLLSCAGLFLPRACCCTCGSWGRRHRRLNVGLLRLLWLWWNLGAIGSEQALSNAIAAITAIAAIAQIHCIIIASFSSLSTA